MDINSLLSPQDTPHSGHTPHSGPSTPVQSPRKTTHRARSTSLKQSVTSSPHSINSNQPSTLPHHVLTPSRKSVPSPPAMSPTSGAMGGTPPPSDVPTSRQPSTPSMDTLADLASMQHRQPPSRASAPALRNTESYESQLSPSTMFPNVPSIPPNQPTPRSSFDLKMTDVSKEASQPRDFAGTSLSEADQQLVAQLVASLAENPYSYEHHRQYCKILHKGFTNHVYPPESPESMGNPHQYDLLKDLRLARKEMGSLYAVGHDLWAEWIEDESLLASNVEERIAVMELCQRSIEEEFGCTKLWGRYGEWVLYLHKDADGSSSGQQWSKEEKMVGKEVFTWDSVIDVWERGAEATKWRMHDSNLVWDRYMELLLQDLGLKPLPETRARVKLEFERRLQTPHATWDDTFQMFSTFISNQAEYNASYEEIMVSTTEKARDAKAAWSVRETREVPLKRAAEAGNAAEHYAKFLDYLEWSVAPTVKKRAFGGILANALYERAILYFPTDTYLWKEYAYYVIEESIQGRPVNMNTIGVLERATRHCPWSGSLWSQYLLSSESAGQPFDKTAEIKHKATNTGLLDVGDMEEVLKVLTAWCSYLRRRAFLPESTDEDLDIAEMGIRSSIESLQKLGEKKFGEEYKGDPYFRLERVYIKYLSESGSWDNARETYKGLVATRGDSHDFWIRYYVFEMIAWGKFIHVENLVDANATKKTPPPSYATAVLKQALRRPNLDWPERIAEVLISHCEDHEDADELQLAVVEVNRASKAIAKRREKEAAEAAVLAQRQQQQAQKEAFAKELENEPVVNGKRKRNSTDDGFPASAKKVRPEADVSNEVQMEDEPQKEEPKVKRDRENASIVVKNLSEVVSETRIRQFFTECGTINSLKIQTEDGKRSALIEFESKEDAQFAQSRDGRNFEGRTIEVQIGTGSTLYVTNYSPTADESYMRDLFGKYGEIISIRFPSLKFNTHRRFCYVQFKSNASAFAATELDETMVAGNKLVVRISDPSHKQDRSGPQQDGREIYVAGFDYRASEHDLKELFSKFGTVERVRIPLNVGGVSKGFGYVTFYSKESANAALSLNQTTHIGRTLSVSLSIPKGVKRSATTIISRPNDSRASHSLQPDSAHLNGVESRRSSDAMSASTNPTDHPTTTSTAGDRQARTLALMNIPDTVNDARIRALVEPHGQPVKIILRPDHQGAIIEFVDVSEAGKASLALDGAEIVEGRKIRIGTVGEMLKQASEWKTDKIQVGVKGGGGKPTTSIQSTGPIRRPGAGGLGPAARGRRGGLGFSARPKAKEENDKKENVDAREMENGGQDPKVEKKSNEDFRAMIMGRK